MNDFLHRVLIIFKNHVTKNYLSTLQVNSAISEKSLINSRKPYHVLAAQAGAAVPGLGAIHAPAEAPVLARPALAAQPCPELARTLPPI